MYYTLMKSQYTSDLVAVYNSARAVEEYRWFGGLALSLARLGARIDGYSEDKIQTEIKLAKEDVEKDSGITRQGRA